MQILDDHDVSAVSAATAVALMRAALLDHHRGRLLAPPRVRGELDGNDVVFTVGGRRDGVQGFRAYRDGARGGDQVTVVWTVDGRLQAVVVGDDLGARRTGALGAVSVDVSARPDARRLTVIGAGPQAWTQIWAATSVRAFDAVTVVSRTEASRAAFADRVERELGVAAEPVADPERAVADADVVVLATSSNVPVVTAGAIPDGAHVVTVGPKSVQQHETPTELLARAAVVSCDSIVQAGAYRDPFFVPPDRLTSLGAILAGEQSGRRRDSDLTLHCSVGLAGTEVLLAAAVAQAYASVDNRSSLPSA